MFDEDMITSMIFERITAYVTEGMEFCGHKAWNGWLDDTHFAAMMDGVYSPVLRINGLT